MSEYKALYRKWRPVDFDSVAGQDGITDILKYEVENNKISHAYLFCGSRGTGKTSCAKILAKAVNCENPRRGNPCNKCEACRSIDAGVATDVIEMDAASNNGVGDVRTLKDEITFTPAILKYRVYIIDEVHMMTGPAFNALLKTLEEPPSYVVFILATTEYNKLPTTIVSRCQRFDFRRMSSEVIMKRLFEISSAEGINLTEDGARLIARAARGGMRDAVSLLELCAGASVTIDAKHVGETIGTGDRATVYKLISALGKADYNTVYTVIQDIVMSSGDISVFWQEIIDSYRDIMVVKNSDKAKQYLDLTDVEYRSLKAISEDFTMARLSYHTTLLETALFDMQNAVNSKRSIAEIALTRMCDPRLVSSCEALSLRIEELEKKFSMMQLGVSTVKNTEMRIEEPEIKIDDIKEPPKPIKNEVKTIAIDDSVIPYGRWDSVTERIGELRRPMGSWFKNSEAYRSGKSNFVVRMEPFFTSRIKASDSGFAILRGVIAEAEGLTPDSITVTVIEKNEKQGSSLADELEKLIK